MFHCKRCEIIFEVSSNQRFTQSFKIRLFVPDEVKDINTLQYSVYSIPPPSKIKVCLFFLVVSNIISSIFLSMLSILQYHRLKLIHSQGARK